MTELARRPMSSSPSAEILERVVIGGDLAPLSPAERLQYYRAVCESLGLNPLTKPFEYLTLSGRLVLYARKDCTDQLRARDGVSITEIVPQQIGELYVVTVKATNQQGRSDVATGAVPIKGLTGEALANSFMKAETKGKRRVTLSLCGLGMLDESEVGDVPGAAVVDVDPQTGEVREPPPPPPRPSPPAAPTKLSASEFARTTEGSTRVTGVLERTSKASGKTFHVLKFEDGREGTAWDDGVVALAESARKVGGLVIPAIEAKGQYFNVVWLKPVVDDPAWRAPEVSAAAAEDDEIPF